MEKSRVSNHVSSLYSEGHVYKKSAKKVLRAEEQAKNAETNRGTTIPPNNLLKELNRYPALILNADYQPMSYLPLSVCHWQEAIKLIFSGKVAVVDVYEGVSVRAANLEIPLPSVVALNEYVPQCTHKPAFTRRNVFLRDEYTCQYCKNRFHAKDLSLDHVMPRSRGGLLDWDNAVTSCLKCNGRKGSTLLSDLKSVGMKLHSKPRAPSRHELAMKAGKMLPRKVHPSWKPYLSNVLGDEEEDGAMANANHATPDLEALGVMDANGRLKDDLPTASKEQRRTKRMSKNKKKRMKKNGANPQKQMQQ